MSPSPVLSLVDRGVIPGLVTYRSMALLSRKTLHGPALGDVVDSVRQALHDPHSKRFSILAVKASIILSSKKSSIL